MSLSRLGSVFTLAAAVLTAGCTVYPTVGRHGDIGIGVAPAPVYVAPQPYYVPAPRYAPPPVYYRPAPRHHRHW